MYINILEAAFSHLIVLSNLNANIYIYIYTHAHVYRHANLAGIPVSEMTPSYVHSILRSLFESLIHSNVHAFILSLFIVILQAAKTKDACGLTRGWFPFLQLKLLCLRPGWLGPGWLRPASMPCPCLLQHSPTIPTARHKCLQVLCTTIPYRLRNPTSPNTCLQVLCTHKL